MVVIREEEVQLVVNGCMLVLVFHSADRREKRVTWMHILKVFLSCGLWFRR